MNSRTLKRHLKYIVPEMRLDLIKEPGTNPLPINTPDDLEKFVKPLRHYSDYVPNSIMCRLLQTPSADLTFREVPGT